LASQDVIVIIDDDTLVRQSIRRLTNSLGFVTEIFSSADEFIASEVMERTACIIADVNMPDGSAVKLHDMLGGLGCHVPIIFMTALPNRELQARLLDSGAVCVLHKPFSQKEMISCIAKALQKNDVPLSAAIGPSPIRQRDVK
jgi:FixJ family two-component response regulator